MQKYLLSLVVCILGACSDNSERELKTSRPISETELVYKKGDCIMFKLDSLNYGAGIVSDYDKDESGIWYGIIFTNYDSPHPPDIQAIKNGKLMGRKLKSSQNKNGYMRILDGEYLTDSLMVNKNIFTSFGKIQLTKEATLGAYGATKTFSDLDSAYRYGQEKRLSPPDDYRDFWRKINNFRPDEYFNASEFIVK